MRLLAILFFFTANCFAQSSNVVYPISQLKGGWGISMSQVNISSSGTLNNLSVTSGLLTFTGTSTKTLTGMASIGKSLMVVLSNTGSSVLIVKHENASSSAANRFSLSNGVDFTIPTNSAAFFYYDTNFQRWKLSTEKYSFDPASFSIDSTNTVYLSSSVTDNFLWAKTGNEIYNKNSGNIWIGTRTCTGFNEGQCSSYPGQCSLVLGNDCHDFDGQESSCNDHPGQCSYDGGSNECNGNYFSSCIGDYRSDDSTQSRVQIFPTNQCTGSAAACSNANCGTQLGCGPQIGNSCSAQGNAEDCSNAGCSPNDNQCSQWDNNNTQCNNHVGDGCVNNSCGGATNSTDCTNLNGACSPNMAGDCHEFNGDSVECAAHPDACNYIDTATCHTWDGDSGTCSGNNCNYHDEASCNTHNQTSSVICGNAGCGPYISEATCNAFNGDGEACAANLCRAYVTQDDCTPFAGDETSCLAAGCDYSDPICTGEICHGEICHGEVCTGEVCYGPYFLGCDGLWCSGSFFTCDGDNSSCPGSPNACSGLSLGQCPGQTGCSINLTPSMNSHGDNIFDEIKITGANSTGKALCTKSNGYIGQCTTAVGSSGSCTCT
jgi:hypothetical protein